MKIKIAKRQRRPRQRQKKVIITLTQFSGITMNLFLLLRSIWVDHEWETWGCCTSSVRLIQLKQCPILSSPHSLTTKVFQSFMCSDEAAKIRYTMISVGHTSHSHLSKSPAGQFHNGVCWSRSLLKCINK